ncbi:MAG: hypothetical protein R3B68_14820 [Phycisphaerales bacterium]
MLRRRTRRPARHPQPAFALESLEPRQVLAVVTWDGGGGSNLWSNPLNWSGDVLPGPDDDVNLIQPGLPAPQVSPGLVVADAGPIEIKSLRLYRSFVLNAGVDMRITGTLIDRDLYGVAGEVRINGDLRVENRGATPANLTILVLAVQPGGSLVLGAPDGARTPAYFAIENLGRVRLQNLDPTFNCRITNAEQKVVEASDVRLDARNSGLVITNAGMVRVDGAAGSFSSLRVENTGSISAQGATLHVYTTLSTVGEIVAADSGAKIRLIAPVASLSSSTGPAPFDFFNTTFAGDGTITIITSPYRRLRLGNTTVGGNLIIETGMPIDVAGGRLTVSGTLTQYGDDSLGDFYGSSQIYVTGTLRLAGPDRSLYNPLIITPTGRVETSGLLTLFHAPITNQGAIARTGPGTTRILANLDNQGTIDAAYGTIELLGPIEQLSASAPGINTLSGGEWIARHDATLAWPAGVNITSLGSQTTLGYLGDEARILATDSLSTNRGTIILAGGREDFLSRPGAPTTLINLGTVRKVGAGETTIAVPVDIRTNSSLTGRVEVRRGRLVLVGDAMTNRGVLDVASGTLKIDLADEGTLRNLGTIDIGAGGRLKLLGSLDMDNGSVFQTEVTAPRYGRAVITGGLDIAGAALRATFVGDAFAPGRTRRIIAAASRTGTFGTFEAPGLGVTLTAQPVYGADRVAVRVLGL